MSPVRFPVSRLEITSDAINTLLPRYGWEGINDRQFPIGIDPVYPIATLLRND